MLAAAADPAAMRREIEERGQIEITVDGETLQLTAEDVQVELGARPGWAASQGRGAVVILKTDISEELRCEGLARELVHHIQQFRKELALRYEQRIIVAVAGNPEITAVAQSYADTIGAETLATRLTIGPLEGASTQQVEIEGQEVTLWVKPE